MGLRLFTRLLRMVRVARAGIVFGVSKVSRRFDDTGFREAFREAFRHNRMLVLCGIAALCLGLVGYMIAGLSFFNAVYAAAALFFVNPVNDAGNLLIVAGKYLSLIVAAGVMLRAVSYVFRLAGHYRVNRYEDSTAVYTDNAWGEALAERLNHGYLGEKRLGGRLEEANHHIFMYSDDLKNLNDFAAHREALAGKHVYVMLNATDAFLLKGELDGETEGPHYFNVYDILARTYWREHNLYGAVAESHGEPVRVAIIGGEEVGRAICRYALMNNLYRLEQSIEYHLWGFNRRQQVFLDSIDLMNEDRIVVHAGDAMDDLVLLKSMNRIILTRSDALETLQTLLYDVPDVSLHCYNDGRTDLAELFDHIDGNLITFGDMDKLLTERSIKQESLYRQAKLMNYDYLLLSEHRSADVLHPNYEQEMEQAWRSLSGFHKGSNIARADHLWVKKRLEEDGCIDEIGNLEHLRWCRFHFCNHWTYADQRDNRHRKHNLLLKEVPGCEQIKDEIYHRRIAQLLEQEGQ